MYEANIALLVEATATRVPERPAVIHRRRATSYRELVARSRRLARYLNDRGLGFHHSRTGLGVEEIGHDTLAQYLYSGPAYIEGLLGAYRGRLVPFNVNYRYTAEELRYVLADGGARVVQYQGAFAPVLAQALPGLPRVELLLQVDDGSGAPLLPGAVEYEQALASVEPDPVAAPSPDDLYLLYTGGTTGLPKGALWRQADAAVGQLELRNRRERREWASLEERLGAIPRTPRRVMALAPYMHGAAQAAALKAVCEGNTVVVPDSVHRFSPEEVWAQAAEDSVTAVTIVGDAFAGPLADEIENHPRALPRLEVIVSGGAALSDRNRLRLEAAVPGLVVIESIGTSESGVQGRREGAARGRQGRVFALTEGSVVLSEDRSRILEPDHGATGWLATGGRVPLGYLGDRDRTAETFVTVDGRRLCVAGDRVRYLQAGLVELLGRDSTVINTGGEKVFAEEVELAIRAHPAVTDAVVCGRPSPKWGAEVVALVVARPGVVVPAAELIEFCRRLLASFKVPKEIVFVDVLRRSPAGKADYRWAAEQVK